MKKNPLIVLMLLYVLTVNAQTAQDLFQNRETKITYLGIDFSHVKLIGNFSEFFEAGQKNTMEVRNVYFPRWNRVVVDEREKYDIAGMLRRSEVYYDIDMISDINAASELEGMESLNTEKFTDEQIQSFVSTYNPGEKDGIGIVFIAESLNKSSEEGVFHFVAIRMSDNEVLFHRRLIGEPNGFGLRNYWVNSLYRIIQNVKFYYYNEWQQKTKEEAGHQVLKL